ncbi:MAG: hypothetical protein ACOC80_15975 [Petrotogales bacterium]
MGMGIDLIVSNTGMSFEVITIIVVYLGIFVFYAKDFRLGTYIHAVGMMALLVWFYETDMAWQLPLAVMIVHIIILSFTIFALAKQGQASGGLI